MGILEVTEEDGCSDDGPSILSQQVGAISAEPGGCGGAWLTL